MGLRKDAEFFYEHLALKLSEIIELFSTSTLKF